MRQEFLSQVEQTLPAIMATSKVEVSELPALPRVREAAGSALLRHRKLREGATRYTEQARHIRTVIKLLRKLDSVYLALPRDNDDTGLGEEVEDEHLRRVLRLVELAISNLEADNDRLFPFITQFSVAITPVVRVFKKTRISEARVVANDVGDLINAMISAIEANRDLLLAMRILRVRLETELTGTGNPANTIADVEQFLVECWT